MKIDNFEIAVSTKGIDETVRSLETLTAAINAANAALDAFGDRHPNVRVTVVGTVATLEIGGSADIIHAVRRHEILGT